MISPLTGSLMPLTLPRRAAAVAMPWWLSGGVDPSHAIAVYQPKGAANLAASYINLANPGTYNAAPGSAPAFDALTGWTGDGIANYLDTGIVPTLSYTVVCRFSGNTVRNGAPCVASSGASNRFGFTFTNAPGHRGYSGSFVNIAALLISGVLAISGRNYYVNGAYAGTISTGGAPANQIQICGNQNTGSYFNGNVLAVAIYSTTLSAAQVAAISAAMAAL